MNSPVYKRKMSETNIYKVERPTVFFRGLTARPLSTGFIRVDVRTQADAIAFTPEIIATEQMRLGGANGWRWRKEYEGDFLAQAGQHVFSNEAVETHRGTCRDKPLYRMDLDEDGMKLVRTPTGRLLVYVDPTARPEWVPEDVVHIKRQFAFGMDIGAGVGKSDSTMIGLSADIRDQVAEFCENGVSPSDVGRFAVATAKYFNNALLVPVGRMHGLTAIRAMIQLGYTRIWHHAKIQTLVETSTSNLGWMRGEMSDPLLFGRLKDAVEKFEAKLYSLALVEQLGQYIYDKSGRICHSGTADMTVLNRYSHGDRVVGLSLAIRGVSDLPKFSDMVRKDPPSDSYASRKREQKRQKEAAYGG